MEDALKNKNLRSIRVRSNPSLSAKTLSPSARSFDWSACLGKRRASFHSARTVPNPSCSKTRTARHTRSSFGIVPDRFVLLQVVR
jgi:hypothetical protein